MTCPSADGNRNALLALHFGEADAAAGAATRAHVESCASCRAYLAQLDEVTRALALWADEPAPAGIAGRIVAEATRHAQAPPAPARRRPAAGALPLMSLLPVMGALILLIRRLAGWLPALSFWPELERWPALETTLPFAAATAAVLAVGGLAALAAAPALMLEARR